jgi:hypothetical protein
VTPAGAAASPNLADAMADAPSPPEPGDESRNRNRVIGIVAGVVAVIVAVLVVLLVAGGGDDTEKTTSTAPVTVLRENKVSLPLGDVSADSAGAAVTVSPEQSAQVLAVLGDYVKDATVQPLRSGTTATADLGTVFDPGTLAQATTADRGVVLDEGLPKVTGNLDVVAQPIAMVGLGDQGGNLSLVTAAVSLDVQGQTAIKGDPLHIVRRADFVLSPDGAGGWKVTAYSMVVTRAGAGLDATTTTSTTGAVK